MNECVAAVFEKCKFYMLTNLHWKLTTHFRPAIPRKYFSVRSHTSCSSGKSKRDGMSSEHFGWVFTRVRSLKKQNKPSTKELKCSDLLELPLLESKRTLTCVHDNVSHLWCHLGDHKGADPLGELFHRYLWKNNIGRLSLTYRGVYEMQTSPDRTCSLAPSPDVTRSILAWLPSPSGLVFSLSSWPADGESSVFGVFAAERNPAVLDALESLGNGERNCKIHKSIFQFRFPRLSSSLTHFCRPAVFGPSRTRRSFAIRTCCVGF